MSDNNKVFHLNLQTGEKLHQFNIGSGSEQAAELFLRLKNAKERGDSVFVHHTDHDAVLIDPRAVIFAKISYRDA